MKKLRIGDTVLFRNDETALVLNCSKTGIKYLAVDGYNMMHEPLSNYNSDLTHKTIDRLDITKITTI